jgi:hypothetical protein
MCREIFHQTHFPRRFLGGKVNLFAVRTIIIPRLKPTIRAVIPVLTLMIVGLTIGSGCTVARQTRTLTPPEMSSELDKKSLYLKAHMRDGRVFILSTWSVEESQRIVSGQGVILDTNRDTLKTGLLTIAIDSVALFETNRVQTSPAVAAMSVLTVASAAMTIYCIINPKACFGSCPTFYAADGDDSLLIAEGFSSSVSPALEAFDIDALYRAVPRSREFSLLMKNEALETHVVRCADLLAVRRPAGGCVFATGDSVFREAYQVSSPSVCLAPEGDCWELLAALDGRERFSVTDSVDLGAKEMIELRFDNVPQGEIGLVLACRQTLLSTYLFYQTLAYMGTSAGQWLALLERGDQDMRSGLGDLEAVLGGIEILVADSAGGWSKVAELNETGPLAADVKVAPLPTGRPGSVRIALRMTKGHWRLDYAALAMLGDAVTAERIHPHRVLYNGDASPEGLTQLLDSSRVLVTYPGDRYTLAYRLPVDFTRYELFLQSRGYYLEWMRQEWLAEESPGMAAAMFLNPAGMLRRLAPEFKRVEPDMETMFWNSRYAH